jgi:hypothetical protein
MSWCLVLAAAIGITGVIFAVWLLKPQPPPSVQPTVFPVPPYSQTPYRNTSRAVQYIGSDACAACHHARHQSYLLTPHSRALADLDPAAEPPDGAFEHKRSGRSFRVYRRDGQFRHEEILHTADGTEIARIDVPVRYVIGSGQFSRSYLVDIDGFLHESPITWYSSRKAWDVSPGYDAPSHWGFERPADGACLVCHAGRMDLGGTLHRVTFAEKAIGCESCHGPGSLHQELHRAGTHEPGTQDFTIVNPGKLPRSLQEAVCAACHLNGRAAIRLRGRELADFRPGMALSDHRIDYRFDSGGERMTVVGHFEQLRRCACYQKSPTLSCLTCHDVHARQRPSDPVAYYRQKCLDCHAVEACRLEPAQRRKQDATDNCMTCHMPRGDTEIPHLVFTHHRIGRHAAHAPEEPTRVPELVPLSAIDHLPVWERQRNLGLAYLEISQDPVHALHADALRRRAQVELEAVVAAGLREGDIAAGLAETYWRHDSERVRGYAKEALVAPNLPAESRTRALFMLASTEMQDGHYPAASAVFEELVRLRRYADDWRLLGFCYFEQDQPRQALAALEHALAIRPYRHTTHLGLADVYRRLGDPKRSQEHTAKARWLLEQRHD